MEQGGPENQPRLILASGSPRRRELLLRYNVRFDVVTSNVDEAPMPDEHPDAFARRAARDKAREVARQIPSGIVIGADTVVTLGDEILGKPSDPVDAERMLRTLSGQTHSVVTGLAVIHAETGEEFIDSATTAVTFDRLEDWQISTYVASGEPLDKAGSYGIQGQGGIFITSITGCYYNVVGLPLNLLNRLLNRAGISLLKS